jgi:hypothetical protein
MTISKLATLAVTATASIDNVLLLLAKELEAHRELINSLETQILNIQAREMVADVSNDYNIESRFDRIETRLDMIEARECLREVDAQRSSFESLSERMDAVEVSVEDKLDDMNTRLDRIDCDLEDKLNTMDLDERVTETLQNVTFTVTVD